MSLNTKFSYKADNNSAVRLASLQDSAGGPMSISKDHIIAAALGDALPALTATTREVTHHFMESISFKHLTFDDTVMGDHVLFHVLPKRWSALAKSVADAGTTFAQTDLTSFGKEWGAALASLPQADKVVHEADLSRRPAATAPAGTR